MHLPYNLCLYFSVRRSLENVLAIGGGELTNDSKLYLELNISLTEVTWYLVSGFKI